MKFKRNELIRLMAMCAGLVFCIIAFALFAAPFAQGRTLGTTFSGFELAFKWDSERNLMLFAGWLIVLLLLIGEVFEVTLFVLEKAKRITVNYRPDSQNINLAFIVVELILDIMAAIFIFVTVNVFELGSLYDLGVGAIMSGIFTILAGLCIAFGRGANYFLK